jgi:AcrR family transcriptional regulator/predicted DNA-binding transcriptional regulator AlpA
MKIEELSKESGFSEQSIYGYIRMGLLPKPTKVGFRQTAYDETHLEMLRKIRQLRDEEGLSLTEIRKMLEVEGPRADDRKISPEVRKEQIIDAAIPLFSKNGFENTSISDIMDALKVSSATFYLYFKSKRDLFIECIERLTMFIIPKESWEQVRQEHDFIERERIKLVIFLREFPTFSGILNLVRLSFDNHDQVIAKKARDTYRILTENLKKDLDRSIREGVGRNINTELTSFALLGMAEGLGHRLMIDSRYKLEEAAETLLDFLQRSFLLTEAEQSNKNGETSWNVKDSTGFTMRVRNIRFGGVHQLSGTVGQGKLELDMKNVLSIRFRRNGSQNEALVCMRDGGEIVLGVDENVIVSCDSHLGKYDISLEKISEICLVPLDESGI